MNEYTLIIVGAVLTTVGAVISGVQAYNAKKAEVKAAQEMNMFKEKNIGLTEENQKLAKQSLEKFEQIEILQKKNLQVADEALKTIIGYESYPIVAITGDHTNVPKIPSGEIIGAYKLEFNLINAGEYPLTGVSINFQDADRLQVEMFGTKFTKSGYGFTRLDEVQYLDVDHNIVFATVSPKALLRNFYTTAIYAKDTKGRGDYIITIDWQGGSIEYCIRVEGDSGKLKNIYTQIYSKSVKFDKQNILKILQTRLPKYTLFEIK